MRSLFVTTVDRKAYVIPEGGQPIRVPWSIEAEYLGVRHRAKVRISIGSEDPQTVLMVEVDKP